MSEQTEALKAKWEELEAKAVSIQNEKDAKIEEVREKYAQKQVDAVNAAAAAQKEFLDEEVRESLRDRPDGQAVADALGIEL